MSIRLRTRHGACLLSMSVVFALAGCGDREATTAETTPGPPPAPEPAPVVDDTAALIDDGRQAFRFDTFGDEQLWTDQLALHTVLENSVDPTTALKVGLKVDADALPPGTLESADRTSPATTVALLKLNAIVGVQATVDADYLKSL